MSAERKRKRIHPGVAIAGIAAICIIVVSGEIHSEDPLVSLKLIALAIIGYVLGLKMRLLKWFPLT